MSIADSTTDLYSIKSKKCIERLVLPPPGSSRMEFKDPAITFSNLSAEEGKPHIGLLFVAPGKNWGPEANPKLEQEAAEEYGQYFDGKLIAVECGDCLTEHCDELRGCAGPWGPAIGIPGLLFWPSDGLRVRVSHDDVVLHRFTNDQEDILRSIDIDGLVGQLELTDHEDSTLLLFLNASTAYTAATACLFDAVRRGRKGGKLSVWGGYFNDDASIAEKDGPGVFLVKSALFASIRLAGPRLVSASTVVRCSSTREQVRLQLRRLKCRLVPRRRRLLLMSGPVKIDAGKDSYTNCKEYKAAAKKQFGRGIEIFGAFSNTPHVIGVESLTDSDVERRFVWHNCMSLMLLTYD